MRHTPKKPKPVSAVDVLGLEAVAQRAFDEAMRMHEIKVAALRLDNEDQLHTRGLAESLGLPADLPDEAVKILGHTMALDKLEPEKPDRESFFVRLGVVDDKPTVYLGRRRINL